MANQHHPTPMLDELENGPWPSFISGIKRLRDEHPDERIQNISRGNERRRIQGHIYGVCISSTAVVPFLFFRGQF